MRNDTRIWELCQSLAGIESLDWLGTITQIAGEIQESNGYTDWDRPVSQGTKSRRYALKQIERTLSESDCEKLIQCIAIASTFDQGQWRADLGEILIRFKDLVLTLSVSKDEILQNRLFQELVVELRATQGLGEVEWDTQLDECLEWILRSGGTLDLADSWYARLRESKVKDKTLKKMISFFETANFPGEPWKTEF